MILLMIAILFVFASAALHWKSKQFTYKNLESLLSQKKWIEADLETSDILGKLTATALDKRKFFGYSRLDIFGLETSKSLTSGLPCEDLQEIDRLWSSYSRKRYGFAAQSSILSELRINIQEKGNYKIIKEEDAIRFRDRLGWNIKTEAFANMNWNFSDNNQSIGFLPSNRWALYNGRTSSSPTSKVILLLDRYKKCL